MLWGGWFAKPGKWSEPTVPVPPDAAAASVVLQRRGQNANAMRLIPANVIMLPHDDGKMERTVELNASPRLVPCGRVPVVRGHGGTHMFTVTDRWTENWGPTAPSLKNSSARGTKHDHEKTP